MTNAGNGQRNKLARIVMDELRSGPQDDPMTWPAQAWRLADAIVEQVTPRTITTVEELEALQDGIILKCGGVTYEHHDGWFHGVDGSNVTAELISRPAVILWEEMPA